MLQCENDSRLLVNASLSLEICDGEDNIPFVLHMRAVASVKGLCCIKTVQEQRLCWQKEWQCLRDPLSIA